MPSFRARRTFASAPISPAVTRQDWLRDVQAAAPLALCLINRYILVRSDGRVRTYEPDDHLSNEWVLRQEGPMDDVLSHVELALLRSQGRPVKPDQLAIDVPHFPRSLIDPVRRWWAEGPLPVPTDPSSRPRPT